MGNNEEQEIGQHYLYQSNLFVSKKPFQIQTILGSCVAVCLFDHRNKFGGMNHFMVPLWNGVGLASPKYGNIAVDSLIENMLAIGSQKKDIIAKVFGGANQFDYKNDVLAVGARNIQVAKTMLESHRITIVSESLGGIQGRKILFDTSNGQVLMKYIVKQNG
jgi:chemotaxis protein CheD